MNQNLTGSPTGHRTTDQTGQRSALTGPDRDRFDRSEAIDWSDLTDRSDRSTTFLADRSHRPVGHLTAEPVSTQPTDPAGSPQPNPVNFTREPHAAPDT